MANRGTPKNPSEALGVNEYAGFVAPKRAAQSTVGAGGNQVDRASINKTKDSVGKQGSQAKPGGTSSGSGY